MGAPLDPHAIEAVNPHLRSAAATGEADRRLDAIERAIAGGLATPGDLKLIATAAAPTGWLLANGAAVSRTTYAALFNAIGTAFGVGDGSTTFNLPDLVGRFPLGAGTAVNPTPGGATAHALAAKGGEESHQLLSGESGVNAAGSTDNDTPDHAHTTGSGGPFALISDPASTVFVVGGSGPGTVGFRGVSNTGGATSRHTHPLHGRDADLRHNTMPPYTTVNYAIKT